MGLLLFVLFTNLSSICVNKQIIQKQIKTNEKYVEIRNQIQNTVRFKRLAKEFH